MNLAKFISRYCIFIGLLIGLVFLLNTFSSAGATILAPKFWVIFCFMASLTFIAYVVAYLGIKSRPESGVTAIMASIAIKLLFCMAFVLVYRSLQGGFGIVFVLNFFCLYLFFSVFEIYCLLRNLRT